MLSGEVDFVLRCVARDLGELQTFITQQLTAAKNVASVKTALAIRQSKQEPGIPMDAAEPRSEADGGLARLRMNPNGRRSDYP